MKRYKEFPSSAAANLQSSAIDKALGLPKKGVNVGNGPHAPIPNAYSPGAIGWTATECAVLADAQSGTALLVLTDAAVALGARVVDVDGTPVALDLTVGVVTTKPDKYKPKQQAEAVAEPKV